MPNIYVYRLDVGRPEGSDRSTWKPEGWEPDPDRPDRLDFYWPRARLYLSKSGAEARAELLRSYGATVTVVRSMPVLWPVTLDQLTIEFEDLEV